MSIEHDLHFDRIDYVLNLTRTLIDAEHMFNFFKSLHVHLVERIVEEVVERVDTVVTEFYNIAYVHWKEHEPENELSEAYHDYIQRINAPFVHTAEFERAFALWRCVRRANPDIPLVEDEENLYCTEQLDDVEE